VNTFIPQDLTGLLILMATAPCCYSLYKKTAELHYFVEISAAKSPFGFLIFVYFNSAIIHCNAPDVYTIAAYCILR